MNNTGHKTTKQQQQSSRQKCETMYRTVQLRLAQSRRSWGREYHIQTIPLPESSRSISLGTLISTLAGTDSLDVYAKVLKWGGRWKDGRKRGEREVWNEVWWERGAWSEGRHSPRGSRSGMSRIGWGSGADSDTSDKLWPSQLWGETQER